jgi:hypothetical protein
MLLLSAVPLPAVRAVLLPAAAAAALVEVIRDPTLQS